MTDKKYPRPNTRQWRGRLQPRSVKSVDKELFLHTPRDPSCLFQRAYKHIKVKQVEHDKILVSLSKDKTIEHQFLTLRSLTHLDKIDYNSRVQFTKLLLGCLLNHHKVIYEGILFGSSVNGLGFHDSDVDLRLRPLGYIPNNEGYELLRIDENWADSALRNIAYQTTRCSPAMGEFIPSNRCPIAKMTFMSGGKTGYLSNKECQRLVEGLKFDISMNSTNYLGSFNSKVLRFFCSLEPKFHLLATTIRYWSVRQSLIVPGYLSSYALINMLIFFCQTTSPPILPTIDQMREKALKNDQYKQNGVECKKGLLQLEWQCILSLDKSHYERSANREPLGIILLKFFEFYLNFPYSTQIITTRLGKSLSHDEFKLSPQYHPQFPIKSHLNIQDPFELKHNLTSGMQGASFRRMILIFKTSYERLFLELLNNFVNTDKKLDWGLIAIFKKIEGV